MYYVQIYNINCITFLYNTDVNLALHKPVRQSTTHTNKDRSEFFFRASQAADGDESNNFPKQFSCSLSNRPKSPQWLLVDLQQLYFIHMVTLLSRKDTGSQLGRCLYIFDDLLIS